MNMKMIGLTGLSFADWILNLQQPLGLKPADVWFLQACVKYGTDNPSELAELTGTARTTISGIRDSLIEAELYHKTEGMAPMLEAIKRLNITRPAGQNPANRLFSTLSAHEQIVVVDRFSCRVCNKVWTPGSLYRVRKVVEGTDFWTCRVVVCKDCERESQGEEVKKRLAMYIEGRKAYFEERRVTFLTDHEEAMMSQLQSKKLESDVTDSVKTDSPKPKSNVTDSDGLDFDEDTSKPSKQAPSPDSPPHPPLSFKLPETGKDGSNSMIPSGGYHVTSCHDNVEAQNAPTGKRSSKSITTDDEDGEELMCADRTSSGYDPKTASKQIQKAKERWDKWVKRLETVPPAEWKLNDCAVYLGNERNKVFKYNGSREGVASSNKHIKIITEALDGMDEYVRFVPWVMNHWHEFWFGQDKQYPTSMKIAGNIADLVGAFKGQTLQSVRREKTVTDSPEAYADLLSPKDEPVSEEQKQAIADAEAKLAELFADTPDTKVAVKAKKPEKVKSAPMPILTPEQIEARKAEIIARSEQALADNTTKQPVAQ